MVIYKIANGKRGDRSLEISWRAEKFMNEQFATKSLKLSFTCYYYILNLIIIILNYYYINIKYNLNKITLFEY